MATKSNTLIQQLLKAEEEAETIVKRARENRVKKLKQAKDAADDELRVFRQREEEKFKHEFEAKYGGKDGQNEELERATQQEINMVRADYLANKDAVLDFVIQKVLQVDLNVPTIACRAMRQQDGLEK
eukprot:GDKI01009904.1.p3 GENE.GDKI01009904.1~~GDKI01009904.1.p3  ORF type:complete len:128 (-),score=69.51 GDKI01009904.1:303-686(-)